jgi:molecular chaperone DnaJ
VELNIPSGTQVGSGLRIPGEGLPRNSSSTARGDMFVRVRIEVPKKVTDEERELLMKLDSSASTGKKGKKKSILDKITDTVTGSK